MPQLRWTLLCLGVLFIILLAWIERRRQRQRGFTDHSPSVGDKEPSALGSPPPAFREPSLTLPEMRARDPGPPHELPVVEIEDDSLMARRSEGVGSRAEPPTLSLPVLESGPVGPQARLSEPTVAGVNPAKLEQTNDFTRSASGREIPRLDTPASRLESPALKPASPPDKPAAAATNGGDATTSRAKKLAGQAARPAALKIQPSEPDTTSDSEERAFNEAVFGTPGLEAVRREPDFSDEDAIAEGAIADGAPAQGMSADSATAGAPPGTLTHKLTVADVTPIVDPIVEWPPDDQRRVLTLRLVAVSPERLAGRSLRLALASEGFVLGKFQIFHKPDETGRAVLSAANLSKPGTFDLDTMDVQRYVGVTLFAVLPGPRAPLKTFDDLLAAARNLNERLQGALQDERGGPLTPTRIATLRETLAAEAVS